MTASPCAVCSAPHQTRALLDTKCAQQLVDALLALPDLVADLHTALSKQAVQRPSRNAVRDDARLPFNLGASTVLSEVRAILLGWARLVADERTTWELVLDESGAPQRNKDGSPVMIELATPAPTSDDPEYLARWLYRHSMWLIQHEAAADAHAEITALPRAAREAIDIRPDPVFVGVCRSRTDRDGEALPYACRERLYTDDTGRGAVVACPKCETVHTARSLRSKALDAAEDRLLTAKTMTRALTRHGEAIGEHSIKNWHKRGLLEPAGWDARQRAHLYRVGDVRNVIADMDARLARLRSAAALRDLSAAC